MSVALPNGAQIAIASAYGATRTMSAITNAAAAVATLEASHGVVVNDILEVTSGWSKLNSRIVRASAVATNDVTLGSINTASTVSYPAGAGVGTVREISAWTQLTQVLEATTNGGDQQFFTYSFLEDDTEKQIPTQQSPMSFEITLADDSSLAWFALLQTASEDRLARAVRITLPSGALLYYNGFISFNETPTLAKNNLMSVKATISLIARQTRY